MVVVFPIELRGTLIRQGELPLVVEKVGYGEGYYEVSARDVLGPCAPVDCRIVRRSSPTINLLFTPCTLKNRNVRLLSKIRRVYRSITLLRIETLECFFGESIIYRVFCERWCLVVGCAANFAF